MSVVERRRFVIQQHDATRLHWDLRLEHEGVLRSWALPRGVPWNPAENRLAVATEANLTFLVPTMLAMILEVPGIDAILAGHTDAGTRDPLRHPDTGTVVMQTFGQGQHLGVLEFVVDDEGARFERGRLVPVNADRLEPDPAVAARLADYRARHPELFEPVGSTAGALTRSYYGESSLGNAFADIVRAAAGAEVGLMPSGALRRDLPAGIVRRVDLLDAFPFEDRVARVTLSGAVLARVLEQGLSLERGLLQVSGLEVAYDPARPAGERMLAVRVNGVPLDPGARYSVGTLEILAESGDRYVQFADADDVILFDAAFADVLLEAFRAAEVMETPPLGRYVTIDD